MLELLGSGEGTDAFPDLLDGFTRIDEGGQQREHIAGSDTLHGSWDLLFIIRTDVVELRVLFHIR